MPIDSLLKIAKTKRTKIKTTDALPLSEYMFVTPNGGNFILMQA